ncbi:MAG TPA: DUF3341 domain-containing protein [Gemmata sp.]
MSVTARGLLAEFASAEALTAACAEARTAGYARLEAFAPYPLPEAARALGCRRSGVPFLVLLGGLGGAAAGFLMLLWVSAEAYRLNVGGKPPNSWPMFIPIAFELGVLTAALSAFFGVLVLCRLPRFHHPLFGAPLFARATTDGFYLFVSGDDPQFDATATWALLAAQNPTGIEEVTA